VPGIRDAQAPESVKFAGFVGYGLDGPGAAEGGGEGIGVVRGAVGDGEEEDGGVAVGEGAESEERFGCEGTAAVSEEEEDGRTAVWSWEAEFSCCGSASADYWW